MALGCLALSIPKRLVASTGERAAVRFLDFFTSHIRNPNTRKAYARGLGEFLAWCEARGVTFAGGDPAGSRRRLCGAPHPHQIRTHGQAAAFGHPHDVRLAGDRPGGAGEPGPCGAGGRSTLSGAARRRCCRPRKLGRCWTASTPQFANCWMRNVASVKQRRILDCVAGTQTDAALAI